MGFHKGLERRTIAAVTDPQADVPAAAANPPGNRWSITLPGAMPTGVIGTTARRVSWISMLVAFLASVFVEFIGFGHRVRQAAEGGEAGGPTPLGCHAGAPVGGPDRCPNRPPHALFGLPLPSRAAARPSWDSRY